MKKVFLISLIFISFLAVFGQNNRHTVPELQKRLDSLYFLQQEAIRRGEENNLATEIRQLQTVIQAENARFLEERANNKTQSQAAKEANDRFNLGAKLKEIFANREPLDILIIAMGAIAVLAAVFLLFTRLFLAISPKSKKSAAKNKKLPKRTNVLNEKSNVLNEIDRYKEKEAQKAEFSQSIIYSLKELASQNKPVIENIETLKNVESKELSKNIKSEEVFENEEEIKNAEEIKKPRVMDLKNEIVKRFNLGDDKAKIAQEFNISQDQVLMILKLAGKV
jgi:hypothetical protein